MDLIEVVDMGDVVKDRPDYRHGGTAFAVQWKMTDSDRCHVCRYVHDPALQRWN